MKAKSRLNLQLLEQEKKAQVTASSVKPRSRVLKAEQPAILLKYIKHLPALFASLPFYYAVLHILSKIRPEQIQDFLVPNTYLPLQLPLFIANFFCFSFIFLKSRRGFLLSLFIALNLFLKLQGVLTLLAFFVILAPLLLFEFLATAIDRK